MISNETLQHKPSPIGLGWLDDSMKINGPTEENKFFVSDTGSTLQDMQDHVAAYRTNMGKLAQTVVEAGGFWWQLVKGRSPGISRWGGNSGGHHGPRNVTADQCASTLRENWCME